MAFSHRAIKDKELMAEAIDAPVENKPLQDGVAAIPRKVMPNNSVCLEAEKSVYNMSRL